MTTSRQSRYFFWLLLAGLGALGYLFFYMKADVAIPVQGRSMRGLGNLLVRADADASIKAVHITEGVHVTPGTPILSLNDVEVEAEMASLNQEIRGVMTMMQAKQALLTTHEKEYQAVKAMVDRGLEPAGELRKAELAVNTAKAEIAESEAKIGVLQAQGQRLAAKALRYQIVSPHAGTLLKLLKYNIGDVVKAGDPVAEIVPEDGDIVFEAKVNPTDISSVKVGNDALIALSAFNRYEVTPFNGKVSYVSPASLTNSEGETYFIARITPESTAKLPKEVVRLLDVGQTADISIKSSERSVMAFLLAPIIRGSSKVFTEK